MLPEDLQGEDAGEGGRIPLGQSSDGLELTLEKDSVHCKDTSDIGQIISERRRSLIRTDSCPHLRRVPLRQGPHRQG